MSVCVQFQWRSGGRWVGPKPQDDRFTVLCTIDNSPLCISLFPVHPNSALLHSFSIFIPCSLSAFCPGKKKSVASSSPSNVFLFFSFHPLTSCYSLCPHNILQSAPCLCCPSVSSPLLCAADLSSVWPLSFWDVIVSLEIKFCIFFLQHNTFSWRMVCL